MESRTERRNSNEWVKAKEQRQIDQWIDASDAYVAKHGLPGAEYSPA
jgi:hypothetical protein